MKKKIKNTNIVTGILRTYLYTNLKRENGREILIDCTMIELFFIYYIERLTEKSCLKNKKSKNKNK